MERNLAVVRLADDLDARVTDEARPQCPSKLAVVVADEDANRRAFAGGAGRREDAPAPQPWGDGGDWAYLHWPLTIRPRQRGHKVPFGYVGASRVSLVPEWDLAERLVGAIVLGMTKMRVLIAEQHPSVRENLRYLINAEPDMECVGVARNGRQCLELCRQLLPEVLVVDEILPGADGLAIAAIVGNRLPQIRVVMYTLDKDVCKVARGFGVVGCVSKDMPYSALAGALRQAAPVPSVRAH
jgi:CheY-like chemotaxis protein